MCEIILNLGEWFSRRCRLEIALSTAPLTLSFGGVNQFVKIG